MTSSIETVALSPNRALYAASALMVALVVASCDGGSPNGENIPAASGSSLGGGAGNARGGSAQTTGAGGNIIGGSGAGATGGSTGTEGGAGAAGNGGSSGTGDGGAIDREWALWPMPNPASSALPSPQTYDTTSPAVVIDSVTTLMWQRPLDGNFFDWADANAFCHKLSLATYSDWRAPTVIELGSIVDTTAFAPAISATAFPNTSDGGFWTATAWANNPSSGAWFMNLHGGAPDVHPQSDRFPIRCVRGGPAPVGEHYLVENGTVRDNWTRVTWQQAVTDATYSWEAAGMYCSDLVFAGQSDWRLPTLWELETLIDYRHLPLPALDNTAFPATPTDKFWTSSQWGSGAWSLDFGLDPTPTPVVPTVALRARCVR